MRNASSLLPGNRKPRVNSPKMAGWPRLFLLDFRVMYTAAGRGPAAGGVARKKSRDPIEGCSDRIDPPGVRALGAARPH